MQTLITRLTNGDEAAFKQLHGLLFKPLYHYALMLLKTRETAEEATADVFVKLWLTREQLTHVNHPQLYIFRSLKNICLNKLRTEKNKSATLIPLEHQDIQSDSAGPIELVHNKELEEFLTATVAALPEQRRLAFTMIKDQGMKNKDVAELLGISPRTVENHVYKAIKQLAAHIEIYLEKDPRAKRKGKHFFSLFF
ncbi:RNA polymerase sigma-70 factor [Sphingobacterium suaedae]|uniref:RNA polymerase sigma-70 factor n=1 Tax=Sphingobacterium suaedae TaxID=1686402 RepID=A0ABW5KN01_9SPHI